ncbi:MAG: hypothetical protein Pg6C_15280 [Treponemataceae bacterium]|nr:MAG: hypothetical protein Pg6C_15280 [Treponemataceae bacterium]
MGKGSFVIASGIRLSIFALFFIYTAAQFVLFAHNTPLTHEYALGEWHGTPVLGVTPVLRYYAGGSFESGLLDVFEKWHPVCRGTYTIYDNIITETVSYVENSFFGKISRIKAGVTVMRVTLQADGTLLSEDAPFGGRVIFTKKTPASN